MDAPRPGAAAALTQLERVGIRKTIMLSGDHQIVADSIARQVGLTEAWGDLMPEDKVAAVDRLREEEQKVAMVGDGVNDATRPGPRHSENRHGSCRLRRRTRDGRHRADGRRTRQAPGGDWAQPEGKRDHPPEPLHQPRMVAFLVPATLARLVGIGPAVVFHEGSTLIVVANALRLLTYGSRGSAIAETVRLD